MPFDAAPQTVASTNNCTLCPVQNCLARRSENGEGGWSEALAPRVALMPGAALFNAGDRQLSIYTVRGGCIKTYSVDADGNERVRGFFLPGDVIGLDGLGYGVHASYATAVVPSQICVMPMARLRSLMLSNPALAVTVQQQTSRDLGLALALSGSFSAEQRVAAFLLHLRSRLGAEQLVRLPMGQQDIGSYLRLAPESVCRTMKTFERSGMLSIDNRAVKLLDERRLSALAAPVGIPKAGARQSVAV